MKKRRIILSVLLSSSLFFCYPNSEQKILAKEDLMGVSGISKEIAETIKMQKNQAKKIKRIEYISGYTAANVNIRKDPSINSEILGILPFNTHIEFYQYDNEWMCVNYYSEDIKAVEAYVKSEYISTEKCKYTRYQVPNNTFKSYMDYSCIKSWKQYDLQKIAYTGRYGIRQVNGRYCVAIGTYFTTEIGIYIDLILENGEIIPCILADYKANKDTDVNNIITMHDGSLAEFIVDTPNLNNNVKKYGNISFSTEKWNSPIVEVVVYEKKVELYD